LGGESIGWDEFEQFSQAFFMALPEVRDANRYGGPGEAQDGIDVEIRYLSGETGGAQCRQRQKFGKTQLKKAIEENAYEADRHLVVTSAVATKPAREEAGKHDNWELLDVEDIGTKIRQLPRVIARWLVEDTLGAPERRAFLGPDGPLTLAHWQRAYARLLQAGRLFSHYLDLVGRERELEEMREALAEDGPPLTIFPGKGGRGKSRLLLELAREIDRDDRPVLFAVEGAELSAQSLDAELPAGPVVLVIDDAHRQPGVEAAIGYAAQRLDLRLLLSCRPSGLGGLRSVATRAGFDADEMKVLGELEPLSGEDSVALAAVAGEGAGAEVLEALGHSTRDCQLITVLGARLLAVEGLPLAAVQSHEKLRAQVLDRFRGEVLGHVSDAVPADKARELLALIAAVQPVLDGKEKLLEALAAELDTSPANVRLWLDALESGGVLMRAGRLRRITPDVLADYVLEERCIDNRGRSTRYSDHLLERFGDLAPERVIASLADLDWRVRLQGHEPTELLDGFWREFLAEYARGDGYLRSRLLRRISKVAALQPAWVLRIAEIELAAPGQEVMLPGMRFGWTADHLRSQVASLVRDAGYDPSHAAAAMLVLWQLGREDRRPEIQHTDHPIRLLKELGGYEPPSFVADLLGVARKLIAEDPDAPVSPLGLLGPPLEREFFSLRAVRSAGFVGRGHLIDAGRSARVRGEALELLAAATSRPGREAEEAVGVLTESLAIPRGYSNQAVPREAVDQWEPEQLRILNILEAALVATPGPVLAAQIRGALREQAENGAWPAARGRATEILDAHPPSLHEDLVDLLDDPWRDILGGDARREGLADRLAAEAGDEEQLAILFDEALGAVGSDANPAILLSELRRRHGELSGNLLRWCVAHPGARLTAYAAPLLPSSRSELPDGVLESTNPVLRLLAAQAYATDPLDLGEEDRQRLRGMLADEESEAVRDVAMVVVARLAPVDGELALGLASAARPGNSRERDRLLHSIDVDGADDDQLRTFLGWIGAGEPFSYEAGQFLLRAAPREPDLVAKILIEYAIEESRLAEIDQMPPVFELVDADSRSRALQQLREAAREKSHRWRLAYLFPVFAGDDYAGGIAGLEDWLLSDEEDLVAAAADLLQEIPSGVVFSQAAQLGDLLNRARHPEPLRRNLQRAAGSGVTSRTPGQPSPEDEERLSAAADAAEKMDPGSPGEEFFQSLERSFAEKIRSDLEEDEEEEWL
jgi:hypothetical protein